MNPKALATAASIAALSSLAACSEIAYPIFLNFTADLPEIDAQLLEYIDTNENGNFELVKATAPMNTSALLEQIPESARAVADIELVDITLTSPKRGHIGEWLDSVQIYLSADDVLDETDLLIQDLQEIDPEQRDFVIAPTQELWLSDLEDFDQMSLIVRAEFHSVPDGAISIPMEVYAEAKVKVDFIALAGML